MSLNPMRIAVSSLLWTIDFHLLHKSTLKSSVSSYVNISGYVTTGEFNTPQTCCSKTGRLFDIARCVIDFQLVSSYYTKLKQLSMHFVL